jgi:iron-sulfur cluster repair protein YtfE (RIC family)
VSTTRTPSPPQVTLPGQAHTAEGPLDMTVMYVFHHAFRRDLARFAAAAERTPLGEREVWAALAERWRLFDRQLHQHHTVEDKALWPPLLELVTSTGSDDDAATLRAMAEEHSGIDGLLDACGAGFAAMAEAPRADVRDRLVASVTATREHLGAHLAHEETATLPLIQRLDAAEAWEETSKTANKESSLRDVGFVVPWVYDGLDRPTIDRAFGGAGPVFRVVHTLARRRYERRERVAFRYASDAAA